MNSVDGDPTIYYPYNRMKPSEGVAAEIRGLDKQASLKETMGFIALCKGLIHYDVSEIERGRDLEAEFYRSARDGVFDFEFTKSLITFAAKHLSDEERKFLIPLSRRSRIGTPAEIMESLFVDTKELNDVYELLISCNESDQDIIAAYRDF